MQERKGININRKKIKKKGKERIGNTIETGQ